jgi:hypothetical protein
VRSSVDKISFISAKMIEKRKDHAKCCLTHVSSRLFAAKQGRDSGR